MITFPPLLSVWQCHAILESIIVCISQFSTWKIVLRISASKCVCLKIRWIVWSRSHPPIVSAFDNPNPIGPMGWSDHGLGLPHIVLGPNALAGTADTWVAKARHGYLVPHMPWAWPKAVYGTGKVLKSIVIIGEMSLGFYRSQVPESTFQSTTVFQNPLDCAQHPSQGVFLGKPRTIVLDSSYRGTRSHCGN